ncbi:iron-containing alcohol dehydrogenase [Nocardia mexicana]|uniref:Alcohol dehydrogenase n=1 Tax=Nocardia mexicana TaxID=279262 RepID=A0A370HEA8_9NOCA|nr:iron-containing alcohol dehydrogenase [Nocardia mexicana]RDI55584.1 alcohol dehydrogenase [Nocardia mexicana]
MILDLHIPTRILFGRGRIAEIGARTADIGGTALLVCGRHSARASGLLGTVETSLRAAGVTPVLFDRVTPDPRSDDIDDAVALASDRRCDVVIGLGGGSAVDAAKAVSAGLRHGPVGPLVATTITEEPLVPVIAVPTTAGSGAEVTKGAIITDVGRGLKAGIRGAALFPHTAVIDPRVLRTGTTVLARDAGFDALAHAVEGYVSRRANPVTRRYAEHALVLLADHLPRFVAGDTGPDILDNLALAALLGGFNVATASTCLPHRLQQAMGSVPAVPITHGRGLAMVYPEWLRRAYPFAQQQFDAIGEILGADDARAAVARVMSEAGIRGRLRDHGFDARHLDTMVGAVTGDIDNDPIPDADRETFRSILRASL